MQGGNSEGFGRMQKKSLRDQQRDFTRSLILGSLAEIVASGDFRSFTMEDLAGRSGVSVATIYRHFPDRDTLLRDYLTWADSQVQEKGVMFGPRNVAELGRAAPHNYAVYEELSQLITGILKLYDSGDPFIDQELAARHKRTAAGYKRVLSDLAKGVDPQTLSVLSELIPYLTSVRVWNIFHKNPDIDSARAAEVVAWVIDLIVRAISTGEPNSLDRNPPPPAP